MIDLVRELLKILSMNPTHALRGIRARFRDLVATHVREFVGVSNRFALHALCLSVFALVFRPRQYFNITGAVIPGVPVFVVDALPTNGIKPVFSDGEEAVDVDGIGAVPPFLVALIGRGGESDWGEDVEVVQPSAYCRGATGEFGGYLAGAHAVGLVEVAERLFVLPGFGCGHVGAMDYCNIVVSKPHGVSETKAMEEP